MPEHLIDLTQRSAVHLIREQQTKMRGTLKEFVGVFSRGDLDLGRTGLVKHHIKTGNASPIKHTPRRIALARREEMQQAVKDLELQGVVERSDSP